MYRWTYCFDVAMHNGPGLRVEVDEAICHLLDLGWMSDLSQLKKTYHSQSPSYRLLGSCEDTRYMCQQGSIDTP